MRVCDVLLRWFSRICRGCFCPVGGSVSILKSYLSARSVCACAESNSSLKPGCNQRLTCVKKNGKLSV